MGEEAQLIEGPPEGAAGWDGQPASGQTTGNCGTAKPRS